jgi:hypothetical protein
MGRPFLRGILSLAVLCTYAIRTTGWAKDV